MAFFIAESVRKSCSFVIRVDIPLQTTKNILEFLLQRKILLETMQMQGVGGGEAILILYCRIEKDRVKHVRQGLSKMNGILSVEVLEGRTSNMIKL
jgi:hypothetical protein